MIGCQALTTYVDREKQSRLIWKYNSFTFVNGRRFKSLDQEKRLGAAECMNHT
jgi:hypothetical protein